jgi:hypothetical protein
MAIEYGFQTVDTAVDIENVSNQIKTLVEPFLVTA